MAQQEAGNQVAVRIISAAFSAIIYTGAFVFPDTILGMMDASTTRRFSIPCTFREESTTAIGSFPILQVPTG